MSTLLVLVLVLPVVAVAGIVVAPARAEDVVSPLAWALVAGWVMLASADEPVVVGDLVVDPVLAAAAVGLAVLVAAIGAHTAIGAGAALLTLAVLPAAAALDPARLPDRRLAAGVVVVALLAAVRLRTRRVPMLGRVLPVLAGLVLASGLVGDDPGQAVALAVAGSTVAVLAAAVWGSAGRLLVPVGLLVVARVAPLRPTPEGTDWVLLVVAGLVVVGAGVLATVRVQPVAHRLPLAGALAGGALLATDVVELRSAGALLGAGGVLALAGRHPVALVALLPGLAAAVDVAGLATQPEHAALGVAVLVAAAAATIEAPTAERGRPAVTPVTVSSDGPAVSSATMAAVAFAAIPTWGWSGAALDDYRRALALGLAVALPAVVLTLPVWRDRLRLPDRRIRAAEPAPAAPAPARVPDPDDVVAALTAGAGRPGARIRRRGSRIAARPHAAPSHGTALHDVDSVPEEGHGEAGDGSPS